MSQVSRSLRCGCSSFGGRLHTKTQCGIAPPKDPLGYTDEELRRLLGRRYDAFSRWMRGQTVAVGDDGEARTYRIDVVTFLAGLPPLD